MIDETSRQTSEFNMAVSWLNRLHSLFIVCDSAAIELNTFNWFHGLMAIFRELSTEMKPDEIEEMNKELIALNPLITSAMQNYQNTGQLQIQPNLYLKLHSIEMRFRKIAKEAGLLTKISDDATKALR